MKRNWTGVKRPVEDVVIRKEEVTMRLGKGKQGALRLQPNYSLLNRLLPPSQESVDEEEKARRLWEAMCRR